MTYLWGIGEEPMWYEDSRRREEFTTELAEENRGNGEEKG